MMEIHLDEKNLQIADKLLSGALVNVRAASSATINRTLPHARKRLVEKAKERYVVKPGPLKGSIRLLKAGAGSMTGIVKSSGHPLPLFPDAISAEETCQCPRIEEWHPKACKRAVQAGTYIPPKAARPVSAYYSCGPIGPADGWV